MQYIEIILGTIIGTILSGILACFPALHVYNVAGIIIVIILKIQNIFPLPDTFTISFMMSLVVSYSIINTVPSVFLGTPDESAMFITLPGQKYLMQGRGYEGTMLTGIGGLGGVLLLGLLSPFFPKYISILKQLLAPHMFWILGLMLAFIVMGEWPKGGDRGTPFYRFIDAWKSLTAGIVTLILSGILGFIILYKPLVPKEMAFQNIMPAFVGLYAIPWIITNVITKVEIPKQYICKTSDVSPILIARGVAAGGLGGMLAAFLPIITGGMGGLVAGHATAQNDDRLFIISQGASKTVYYVGAFLFLFLPGIQLTRGGMAWMVSSIYRPYSYADYYMIVAVILLSGALSYFLLELFTRWIIKLIQKVNFRYLSIVTFFFVSAVVFWVTGWQGIVIMIVSTGIGLIPVLFQSRRMNCMGVLLIPVTLNMAGYGPAVAKFMGLIQ